MFISLVIMNNLFGQTYEFSQVEFTHSVELIVKQKNATEFVLVNDYRKAILYLGKITGHYSRADYSSTVGYRHTKDYKSDLRFWKKWYRQRTGEKLIIKVI